MVWKFHNYSIAQFLREINFGEVHAKSATLGWLGLYSDMSKVGNVNLPGLEIDKHDEISG